MEQQIALVTGASSGIGAAVAHELAEAGYIVYGTSRKVKQRSNSDSGRIRMLALDVTSDDSVRQAVDTVLRDTGRIDLLVNNAGFGVAPAAAEESSMAQAQAIFDTNFFGVVRMTRAVLPHMRQRRQGRIIHIGSVVGFLPMPYGALYAASKHAIEGYAESLDHELRSWNIHSIVVEPAYTRTGFEASVAPADALLDDYSAERDAVARRLAEIMQMADGPEAVGRTVLAAARARRPKLRYAAGKLAKRLSLLRSFAPAGMIDAGLRKDLRLT